MRLLLDTNIVIDLVVKHDSPGFSEPELYEMAIAEKGFIVSTVSLWEIEIKTRIGKLNINLPVSHVAGIIRAFGGQIVQISEDHVLAQLPVEPKTKDPFDRLLLTTAAAEDALLVTRDKTLQSHPLAWRSFPQ